MRRGKKKTIGMTAAAMFCILLLGGCGSASYNYMGTKAATDVSYEAAASMDQEATYVPYAEDFDAGFGYDGGENYEIATDDSASAAGVDVKEVSTNRKLIKTVDMSVETKEFDQTMETIQTQVDALGGYIESRNTYNGSIYSGYGGSRDASLVIRIPAKDLDAFLNEVSQISNVINRSDRVEDITLQYVDLESHADALRTEQSRLLELLEQAETVEDIITIEDRLSDVRYQLESMESSLRTYDNQVDYSTVTVDINEVRDYTPVEKDSPWQRITKGFSESLKNIGNDFVDFGVWFVVHIPYLIIWAVVIVVIVLIIRKITKKRRNRKSQKSNAVSGGVSETAMPQTETPKSEETKIQ